VTLPFCIRDGRSIKPLDLSRTYVRNGHSGETSRTSRGARRSLAGGQRPGARGKSTAPCENRKGGEGYIGRIGMYGRRAWWCGNQNLLHWV